MTSPYILLLLVSMVRICPFLSTNEPIVLHPYYKLDYIKMAWGGAEHQLQEIEAGNRHAKNWHDEALQVIEDAMQDYWHDSEAEATAVVRPPGVNRNRHSASTSEPPTKTLESEFDIHRRLLVEQANRTSSSMGWSAELRCYLTELPQDVSKDMDVVTWWSVSNSLLMFECHKYH